MRIIFFEQYGKFKKGDIKEVTREYGDELIRKNVAKESNKVKAIIGASTIKVKADEEE